MSKGVVAQMGFGRVWHQRLRPKRHAFSYNSWFLHLPMRHLSDPLAMGGLPINRAAAISFFDRDHGDGRGPEQGGALSWLLGVLESAGIQGVDGEIWLQTYPRVLGYTFKPVSFWYCHRSDGSLCAILVEVNNTFGERHCYLLDAPRYGVELHAIKCFHVSPFCTTAGSYRFRFLRMHQSGRDRVVVRVDHDDSDGPLLQTSLSGDLYPLSRALLRRALWRYPAMTAMVVVRIHWQALQLWCKRVGWHRKPPAPDHFVTR